LENLYKDFFKDNNKSLSSGLTQAEKHTSMIETKNRIFKELYTMIEESVIKFYELYVEAQGLKMKNMRLEETF
jgi:hypothetical protein